MEFTAQNIIDYAPLIVVVIAFALKNRIFVTPEQLLKWGNEVTKEIEGNVENKFLTLLEFNEYKKRMEDNNKAVNERLDKIEKGIEHITELLLQRG